MTTTYRMAIPVRAWRVADDGSLPEEAANILANYCVFQDDVDRRWYYQSEDGDIESIDPGEWIAVNEWLGALPMTDARFRACCEEVER